jgi:predicted SAM-dependent methyltransferase
MRKVQFCSGQNHLVGWENYDTDINIVDVLPFPKTTIDFIFIEHGIEHITQSEALSFFRECNRILKPGGVIRVTFPDVSRCFNLECIERYNLLWGKKYHEIKLINTLMINMIGWGHKAFWDCTTMRAALSINEFNTYEAPNGKSEYKELQDIEKHWKMAYARGGYTEEQAKKLEALHAGTIEGVKI